MSVYIHIERWPDWGLSSKLSVSGPPMYIYSVENGCDMPLSLQEWVAFCDSMLMNQDVHQL